MTNSVNFYETFGTGSHPMVVRSPHPSEVPHTQALHEMELPSHRSLEELLGKVHHKDAVNVAAYEGDKTVGAATLTPVAGRDYSYQVDQVTTHPDFRGHGVATKVLQEAEKQAQARGAKNLVADVTPMAHSLFARLGYHEAPALSTDTPEGHINMIKTIGTDGD